MTRPSESRTGSALDSSQRLTALAGSEQHRERRALLGLSRVVPRGNRDQQWNHRTPVRRRVRCEQPETGVPVKRVLARPGIAFKGGGFHANDYRPKEKKSESKGGGGE